MRQSMMALRRRCTVLRARGRHGARPAAPPRLHGLPLLGAWLVWLVVFLLAIGLFVAGLAPRTQAIVGSDVIQRTAGKVLLSPWVAGAAMRAGILDGDTL